MDTSWILRTLFGLVSVLGVVSALGTVLARNLVHAALFLVGFFFTIACQFVLLEAEFLAAVQVLVYIGAVAVLVLFGIMLTRNVQGDETTGGHWTGKLPGGIAAGAVLAVLIVGIASQSAKPGAVGGGWSGITERPRFDLGLPSTDPRAVPLREGMARTVGVELMTRYVIAFEVAGLLLTAAVVGAIALAAGDREEDRAAAAAASRSAEQPAPNGAPAAPPSSVSALR